MRILSPCSVSNEYKKSVVKASPVKEKKTVEVQAEEELKALEQIKT